jgi:peptide/nickel transport system permease protein
MALAEQTATADAAQPLPATGRRSALRGVLRQPAIIAGLVILLVCVLAALLAPAISPYDPLEQNISQSLRPPSASHPFGTDKLGRDVFSRILYGARLSLIVGLAVVAAAALLGTAVGLLAGYLGGWADEAMMRVTDIFFAFPGLILAMAIAGALGPSLRNALIAIIVVTWPVYARLVRGQTLALKEREFIQAAHALGVPQSRIIARHLLPNTFSPLLVQASFDLGAAILSVAGLSFIGFGAQPPTPEWGVMVSEGRNYMATQWWLATFPALAILLIVLSFNLLGDGLRDLLDPRLRGR